MAVDLRKWIGWIFDQPVPEPSLYWNQEELGPLDPDAGALAAVSSLFENPTVLLPYSDAQLSQGFWFLCGAESNLMRGLGNESIPWEARVRLIRSFSSLYRELFMARCTHHLSHLIRGHCAEALEISPLNSPCYMWWDFDCWVASPDHPLYRKLDAEYLEVMRQTLALPHDACREGALHGLGHWHRAYPRETTAIIDQFLDRNKNIREDLRSYAMAARCGCVL
jgi:hypothetical protein